LANATELVCTLIVLRLNGAGQSESLCRFLLLVQVGTEDIPQGPQPVGPCQIVGRQRRYGDQLAQRRDRLAQLPDEILQKEKKGWSLKRRPT